MGARFKDETGHRYGRLFVQGIGGLSDHGDRIWTCLCDCQLKLPEADRAVHLVEGRNLRNGTTRSCGCLRRENARARLIEARARRHGAAAGVSVS